jgi:hypothetical protein
MLLRRGGMRGADVPGLADVTVTIGQQSPEPVR